MKVESDLAYVDSSVILAFLLRERAVVEWPSFSKPPYTSELSDLECRRTLDRIRLREQLDEATVADRLAELDSLLGSMNKVRITPVVFSRAKASFPTVVRSLDALHLATAELAHCSLFFTFDKQQAIAARAIGFKLLDL